uniref:Uncharacterized protein n=1 Tax=Cacopsylla melanoneura TaxID=428564 RepID=A0A8D8VBI0_9HEMI
MFTLWYAVLGYSEYKSRVSDGVVVHSVPANKKQDPPPSGEQNVVSPKIDIGKPTPPQPIPTKRTSPPKPVDPPKPVVVEPPKGPSKPDPPKPATPAVTPPAPAKPAPSPAAPKSREDQLFEQVLNRKTKASTPDPRVTSGLMMNEYSSEEDEEEDSQEEDFVIEEKRRSK